MDIGNYLKKRSRSFERLSDAIADPKVFDFNYLPEQPLMRRELEPVIDALIRFETTAIPNHILVVGPRGSGKTTSVRHLEQAFSSRGVKLVYANCRTHNTSYKLLAELLNVRARGLSFAELASRFQDAHPGKTAVVLDEIDFLSEKDRNREILYFLSRALPSYMVILLSNNPRWAAGLDGSIQSSLQAEQVYFRPYSACELQTIIEDRMKRGLRRFSSRVASETAALTTKYANSDVRVALRAVYYAALDPKTKLEDHFHKARKDIVYDVVRNLNDMNLLILRAGADKELLVKDVYSRYRVLCKQNREQPFSYPYFLSALSLLQSQGLILLMTTKVRRAYTKLMQLTFPGEVLDSLWSHRFNS